MVIINIIYGKNQYSKIPEVDESIFQRTEHQAILPDNEDALIGSMRCYCDGSMEQKNISFFETLVRYRSKTSVPDDF